MLEAVRGAVGRPLSESGEAALRAFFALPGIAEWKPRNFHLWEISRVFDIGLPIALVNGATSANPLRRKIGQAIAAGTAVEGAHWSEIQAGALMSHFGARIEFVPPKKSKRTPDVRCGWHNQIVLDVEVTAADARETHENVRAGLDALIGVIRARDQEWHILAFCADASDEQTLNDVIDVVIDLRPGESKEKSGRWYVRAYPPDQRGRVIEHTSEAPDWWPRDDAMTVAVGTIIGTQFAPTVKFASLLPKVSYINPIANKAERPQCDPSHPYLIAVDVKELPRAHTRAVAEIQNRLTMWDHVSGVLLFDYRPWIGAETKQWDVSLHVNPSATNPLPAPLLSQFETTHRSIIFKIAV